MRKIKKIILLLFLFLLLIVTGLYFLLATHQGLLTSLYFAEKWLPNFHVESAKGSWLNEFELSQLAFNSTALDFNAELIAISLGFHGGVVVKKAMIQAPHCKLKQAQVSAEEPVQESQSISQISLPFALQVEHFSVNDFVLTTEDFSFQFGQALLIATWEKTKIVIDELQFDEIRYQPFDKVAISPHHIDPPQTQDDDIKPKAIKIALDKIKIPVDVELKNAHFNNIHLSEQDNLAIQQIALVLNLQDTELELAQCAVKSTLGDLNAHLKLIMEDDFPLSGELTADIDLPELMQEQIKLSLSGSLKELALLLAVKGELNTDIAAHIALFDDDTPFDIDINSLAVQFPFKDKADAQVDQATGRFNGSLNDYRFELAAQLSGAMVPASQLNLQGAGSLQEISLLTNWLLEGKSHLVIDAKMHFQNGLDGQLSLNLSALDPSFWLGAVEGQINGNAEAVFSVEQNKINLDLSQLHFDGKVNQQPLVIDGIGGLVKNEQQLSANVDLKTVDLGDNHLKLRGEIAESIDLLFDLQAQDLAQLGLGLIGQLSAKLKLEGAINQPDIDLLLSSDLIEMNALSIKGLKIQGKGVLDKLAKLTAHADAITTESIEPFDFNLVLEGNKSNHQLTLGLLGNALHFDLLAKGAWQQSSWHGQLQRAGGDFLTIPLKLLQPIKLAYEQKDFLVSKHCWQIGSGQLCNQIDSILGATGKVDWRLTNLDLSPIIQNFSVENVSLETKLQAGLKAQWQPQQLLHMSGRFELSPGVAQLKQNEANAEIAWQQFFAEIKQTKQQLNINSTIDLRNNGQFISQLSVSKNNWHQVTGKLKINHLQLDFLAPLLSQYYQVFDGQVNANLGLTGSLNKPLITGKLALTNLVATGSDSPLLIERGEIAVNFAQTKALIKGELSNQQSPLALTGNIDWQDLNRWQANINLEGDKVELKKVPELSLIINPKLAVSLSPSLINVSGRLAVPFARLIIESIPASAIAISEDERIISPENEDSNKQNIPLNITSDLLVDVGKDVKIEALGLKADLEGKLAVRFLDNQPQLFGQLNIPNGSYKAFAQSLLIQKGRLIFNGPADQPYIDVEAIRNPKAMENDNITAGIRVTGLASKPRVTIFSDPALSQQNALSYILTGKSIDSGMDANSAMTLMLINMGLAKSNQMVSNLGDSIGIKQLALDAEGAGDESQVSVSGYIAPGLQVKYGVGLFQKLAEFTIRYEFWKDYFIESVSSDEDTSLDVLHQFSF